MPNVRSAGVPPAIVALLRGIAIAVALGALTALIAAITGADLSSIPAEWRPVVAALLIVAVRFLEGLVDQLRGQAPQATIAGSRPASATAYIDTTGGPSDAVYDAVALMPRAASDYLTGTNLSPVEADAVLTLAARRLELTGHAMPAKPATNAAPPAA